MRLLGALLGASVPASFCVVSYWLVSPGLAVLMLIGVVPGLVSGAVFAREAVSTGDPAWVALKATALGVPVAIGTLLVFPLLSSRSLGDPAWPVQSATDLPPIDYASLLAGFVAVALFLLLVIVIGYGIGLVVGFPSAVAAIVILRRVVRLPLVMGWGIVVLMIAATATGGVVTRTDAEQRDNEAAIGGGLERARWIDLSGSPVDLEWTVVNRSEEDLVIVVDAPGRSDEDWSMVRWLPSCQVSAGVAALGSRWTIGFEREDFPEPTRWTDLATSDQHPGPTVRLRFDIAPTGLIRVESDTELPSRAELEQWLC